MMIFTYAALLAQEGAGAAEPTFGITSLEINLMFWTLVIFGITFFIIWKYAMPVIFKAVEAREKALEAAIAAAKQDRDAAAALLAEQQKSLDASRTEAQKLIADSRAVAEKMRGELMEQTRKEQGEMLDRARRDIESEKEKAIATLRQEAVELAITGASKVIEANLDSDKNRRLVEGYLASIGTSKVKS